MDLHREVQALRRRELPPEGFFSGLSPALREAVPFDAAAMLTSDPETHLPAGGVVEGFPERLCGPCDRVLLGGCRRLARGARGWSRSERVAHRRRVGSRGPA